MSASSSVIAALSLMTLPSGISSVGTWASGLTFFSLASASGVRNRSSTGSKVKGSPYQASCASTMVEPQPARPQSL